MNKNLIKILAIICLGFSMQSCDKISTLPDKFKSILSFDKSSGSSEEETTDAEEETSVDAVAVVEETESVSSMPDYMTVSGKIGGKYAVVMTLDIAGRYGQYYYTRSGSGNSLDLVWDNYDPSTGLLEMHEVAPGGDITGYFTGYLTPDGYAGMMTNLKGQEFDFTLTLTR